MTILKDYFINVGQSLCIARPLSQGAKCFYQTVISNTLQHRHQSMCKRKRHAAQKYHNGLIQLIRFDAPHTAPNYSVLLAR